MLLRTTLQLQMKLLQTPDLDTKVDADVDVDVDVDAETDTGLDVDSINGRLRKLQMGLLLRMAGQPLDFRQLQQPVSSFEVSELLDQVQ